MRLYYFEDELGSSSIRTQFIITSCIQITIPVSNHCKINSHTQIGYDNKRLITSPRKKVTYWKCPFVPKNFDEAKKVGKHEYQNLIYWSRLLALKVRLLCTPFRKHLSWMNWGENFNMTSGYLDMMGWEWKSSWFLHNVMNLGL